MLAPREAGPRRAGGAESLWAVLAEGAASGVLTDRQAVMADRVMRINEVSLEDVMVPMSRVAVAPVGMCRGISRRVRAFHRDDSPMRKA